MEKVGNACGTTVSVHDLRRTFRAICGVCGIELWRCKLLLNHKLEDDITLHSYTETSDLRYLSEDVQKIADYIKRQARIASSENVIDMETAKEKET